MKDVPALIALMDESTSLSDAYALLPHDFLEHYEQPKPFEHGKYTSLTWPEWYAIHCYFSRNDISKISAISGTAVFQSAGFRLFVVDNINGLVKRPARKKASPRHTPFGILLLVDDLRPFYDSLEAVWDQLSTDLSLSYDTVAKYYKKGKKEDIKRARGQKKAILEAYQKYINRKHNT